MPSKYVKTPGGVFVPGEQYTYESSEIFLSMVQTEYQNEIDRSAALDSKVGISIPVISTYFFLIVQETDIQNLWNFTLNAEISVLQIIVSLLYSVAIVTAIISLILMILSIMTRNYKKVAVKEFDNAKEMSRSKEHIAAIIATYYVLAIEWNTSQNNKKAQEYCWGWLFGIISLVDFSLYALMQ